jgi:hypothetical protein
LAILFRPFGFPLWLILAILFRPFGSPLWLILAILFRPFGTPSEQEKMRGGNKRV